MSSNCRTLSGNPLEAERGSSCPRVGLSIQVCCPVHPPTTTPTTVTVDDDAENSTCTDFWNQSGSCIRLKNCPKFLEIYMKKPLSDRNKHFLRSNKCGPDSERGRALVCCSSQPIPLEETRRKIVTTTTTSQPILSSPPWLESLNKKVNDESCATLPDRILGGTSTAVDEYPWTVLLEYTITKKGVVSKELNCGGSLINHRYVLTGVRKLN